MEIHACRRDRARTCALVILVGSEILYYSSERFLLALGVEHRVLEGRRGGVRGVYFFCVRKAAGYSGASHHSPRPQVDGKRYPHRKRAFQLSSVDRPRDEEQPGGRRRCRRRRINVDKYCRRDRQPNVGPAVRTCSGCGGTVCVRVCPMGYIPLRVYRMSPGLAAWRIIIKSFGLVYAAIIDNKYAYSYYRYVPLSYVCIYRVGTVLGLLGGGILYSYM